MSRTLDVHLFDDHAGTLTQGDDGALAFAYAPAYLDARGRRLSISLPLREEPFPDALARPYFSNLLPDERARRRLASALGLSDGNAFGLLEIIGGDCAGAVSLHRPGERPVADEMGLEPLGRTRLLAVLAELRERPLLGGMEGVRLSLAGAQDKLAVCLDGETIALAKGGRPTTHILKPAPTALDGIVENETFCMRLAARLGLPAPKVTIRHAGDMRLYLVERYDRHVTEHGVERLHQEDFCQALAVPPELKYEAEGGPGARACLDLIGRENARPAADRLLFLRMLLFHYVIGNADAHAKNYALLWRARAPDLAPVYDALCTAAYPNLSKNFAMSFGGRSISDTIHFANWMDLLTGTRGAARLLRREMSALAAAAPREAALLRAEMEAEDVDHPILARIERIVETRALHLARLSEAG